MTYSALPLGRARIEVLSTFQKAGCDVREQGKGYPDGLSLIDTESIQVQGLPSKRQLARITCACWARIQHADLVFEPTHRQRLYLVERRIDEEEKDPRQVMDRFKTMLDPLLGSPGKQKFQDHRLKGLDFEYRYRTHFMDWYDWRHDVRSYLIIKEVRQKGVEECYVGHIWMPVVESQADEAEHGGY